MDFNQLSLQAEGYSGADISLVSREAIMAPIREMDSSGAITDASMKPRDVTMNDFTDALSVISPSVSPSELDRYAEWEQEFGSG